MSTTVRKRGPEERVTTVSCTRGEMARMTGDGLGLRAISRELGVDVATVSRRLAEGRERGLVPDARWEWSRRGRLLRASMFARALIAVILTEL